MSKLKELIKSKGDDLFERTMKKYGLSSKEAELLYNELDQGSNEGGDGGGSIEYLDLSDVDYMIYEDLPLKTLVGMTGYTMKFLNTNDVLTIASCGALYSGYPLDYVKSLDFRAVKIDFNELYGGNLSTGLMTIKDTFLDLGIPQSELDAIPRITKEEFYKLD